MSTELPKTYDPAAVEANAYSLWLKENAFHAEPNDPGEPYCIVIPPPNVTGALHFGHAINNTLQDILTRLHRMRGFNALWIPGIDHAGIATQAVVEKQLKEQENKTRHDVGREALVERIWSWKQQYGDRIINQLKRLGCSCDWDRTRFTLDDMCARAVRETFFKLFKDGLVYRGKRLVNWDVHLQTSISDDEIYHETVKTNLWHIRYPIVEAPSPPLPPGQGRGEGALSRADVSATRKPPHPSPLPKGEGMAGARPDHMVVATTRPETMLGDTAVAVHPDDPRWNWAIGKSVKLPLTDRLIPIIADPILVNMEFGSGVVKVTPAHDPNDYAVWQRQNGAIDIINILTPEGKINENGGAYAGMKRDAARKKIVEDLTHLGLLEKEEPYETQVGHSDRSKTPVEPYLSDQWFVKMAPLAEPALEVVRNGTIKFFPERHAQQYLSWLGEKRDWPISRQLWWGHRIPVWTKEISKVELSEGAQLIQIDSFGTLPTSFGFLTTEENGNIWVQQSAEAGSGRRFRHVVVRPDCLDCETKLQENGYVQDPDVLDTWFSSALWPHSTLGWPETGPSTSSGQALAKWYPTSVLLTGRDIITLWVARMVMMGMYNMGVERGDWNVTTAGEAAVSSPSITKHESRAPASSSITNHQSPRSLGIPFSHVVINPTILDGKGEPMKKMKGNGVDPVDIIDAYGADALRFTLTHMATETQDVRMPVKKLPDGRNTSEKFDVGRNFCNKLYQASRFVLSNLVGWAPPTSGRDGGQCPPYRLVDRWIISRFNRTVVEANEALSQYRFDQYARTCYDFVWRDFCDWYLEASKPAMKDPNRAGATGLVLSAMLDGALRLMHPMIPFITETIWWKLNEVCPQRGIPGLIECPPSERLIKAAWPIAGKPDEEAEHIFPRMQAIIGNIRNLRNEHKVDQKRTITLSISPPGEEAERVTIENRGLIELLASCTVKEVKSGLAPPADAVRATINGCDIFVEGLADEGAEKQRAGKRTEELTKLISALKGRMANAGYMAKAPPALVQQTQDQLAEAEAELAKLRTD